jgi:hypothetical protein
MDNPNKAQGRGQGAGMAPSGSGGASAVDSAPGDTVAQLAEVQATAQLAEVQLEGGAVEGEGKGEMPLRLPIRRALSHSRRRSVSVVCVCVWGVADISIHAIRALGAALHLLKTHARPVFSMIERCARGHQRRPRPRA